MKNATAIRDSNMGSHYPDSEHGCVNPQGSGELRKEAGLSGLRAMVRCVPCSQQGALWDCPVVTIKRLSENHSFRVACTWKLGPVLPTGD